MQVQQRVVPDRQLQVYVSTDGKEREKEKNP
jgi:hypothetical protein